MNLSTKYANHQNVTMQCGQYGNGRTAIQFFTEEGEPLLTATVNMVDLDCPAGHVWIKDYSENEGILDWMVAEGLILDVKRELPTGYAAVKLAKLLLNPEDYSD